MKIKKNMKEKLNKIAEKYTSFEAIRPVLQLIPFGVGSAIDSLFGNRAYAIQNRRILEFLNILKRDLKHLDETKIDYNFLKSDDFFFLCRDIFNKIANDRYSEKIKFFKNIFILSISINKPSSSFTDLCIKILEDLSIHDIYLMNSLYKMGTISGINIVDINRPSRLIRTNMRKEVVKETGFENEGALHYSIRKLLSLGLVQDEGYTGRDLSLSALGKEFVNNVLSSDFEPEVANQKNHKV